MNPPFFNRGQAPVRILSPHLGVLAGLAYEILGAPPRSWIPDAKRHPIAVQPILGGLNIVLGGRRPFQAHLAPESLFGPIFEH